MLVKGGPGRGQENNSVIELLTRYNVIMVNCADEYTVLLSSSITISCKSVCVFYHGLIVIIANLVHSLHASTEVL